jgi:hypothetical protein
MMKIWVADELGELKSCLFDHREQDGEAALSEVQVVPNPDKHSRRDYVQIMALVNWEAEGSSMVRYLFLRF